eukprot:TRINITY_DN5016_c0_g1_i2.p1 TRINITY_DN5016_c0_g1~~TRINITY_DN5016_c0_g1_i2.p1  ORF type:complete len:288 (-),score=31.76 TRINITY_DN5016_c0_g1_i2:398-1261(-)
MHSKHLRLQCPSSNVCFIKPPNTTFIQPSHSLLTGRADLDNHLPDADDVVSVAGKQGLTVSRPGQADAARGSLASHSSGLQLVHNDLGLEVPNLDGGASRRAQPVAVGAEGQRLNGLRGIQGVQVLALVEVPEHGLTVLAARGTQRAVGGDSHRVEVALVTNVVRAQLAVGQVPDLDLVVPAGRHDNGVAGVGGEADARHPAIVAVGAGLLANGELALGKDVPELDGLVARAGDNLTVVGGEGNREDVVVMANKAASALTAAKKNTGAWLRSKQYSNAMLPRGSTAE